MLMARLQGSASRPDLAHNPLLSLPLAVIAVPRRVFGRIAGGAPAVAFCGEDWTPRPTSQHWTSPQAARLHVALIVEGDQGFALATSWYGKRLVGWGSGLPVMSVILLVLGILLTGAGVVMVGLGI